MLESFPKKILQNPSVQTENCDGREGKALCWEAFKTNTAEESFLIQVGQLETACYVLRSCDGREVKALG